jgi:gamma-glutamyltranspeptidase/glutathione hydrolase
MLAHGSTVTGRGRALLAAGAVASGTRGAVACTARTAAAIGARVLGDGGNAVDAALTAAMVETALMPPKCGLAGEVVGLVLPAGESVPRSLVAVGPAAAELPRYVAEHGLDATGPAAAAVPAAPAGYAALAEYGEWDLAAVVAPAIRLAARGIAWSPLCAGLAAQADHLLLRWQPDGCAYRPRSGPLAVGQPVRLPGLAALLEEFAARGADLFAGQAGDALVRRVRADGGVLTAGDLAGARAEWADPVALTTDAGTIFATGPPTYGAALLDVLRASAEHGHDPALLASAVTRATASKPADPLAPVLVDGTSAVAAVDADGNAAVLVHSNSFPQFGCGLVLADYDLVLSNRPGRGFSADPQAVNAVRVGTRPATTLHAWMLDRPGGAPLLGATSGGDHQIDWNAQLLALLLREPDVGLGEALTATRWERTGSGVRSEDWAGASDDGALVRSSHALVRRGDPLHAPVAAADPRLGGTAIGA